MANNGLRNINNAVEVQSDGQTVMQANVLNFTDEATIVQNKAGVASISYKQVAGIEPTVCKGLNIVIDGTSVKLNWKDSGDTVIDGQYLATWAGTKLVKKLGSYPETPSDGTVLVDNTELNAYANTAFEDTIVAGEDWKYALFPYTAQGTYSYNKLNRFGYATVYEMLIRPTESYPSSKVVYTGLNEHYQPGRMDFDNKVWNPGDWADSWIMKAFRPCMLKHDGTVDYYLNPSNMLQKLDGSASDANVVSYDGEVMVEVDQIWLKEELLPTGEMHVCFSNVELEGYDCLTHINKNNQLVEHYYYAKYNGSVQSNKVRSISGINPTSSLSGVTQRSYCNVHGSGWDCREWSFVRLMWYLHMLIGRTTNAREAFGYGYYTGSSSSYSAKKTGLNDTKGMFYGTTTSNTTDGTVTTFFIDDFYGNLWELTAGLIQSGGKFLVKMTPGTYDGSTATDYNTDGTGYVDVGVTCGQSASSAYIQGMTLVPGKGIFPSVYTGASATTYYCNGFWTANVVGYARTGGSCGSSHGLLYGFFAVSVDNVASHSGWYYGVSLSYKQPS